MSAVLHVISYYKNHKSVEDLQVNILYFIVTYKNLFVYHLQFNLVGAIRKYGGGFINLKQLKSYLKIFEMF